MAYSNLYYSISVYRVERKKRSRDRNLELSFFGLTHPPYFNVGCFQVFWTERNKTLVYVLDKLIRMRLQH